jgi:hypothetical protein
MRIFTSVQRTLWVGAAAAMLAGCNGAANVTPIQSSGFAQNANRVTPRLNLGSGSTAQTRHETMIGAEGEATVPRCQPSQPNRGSVSVAESGIATGAFPGTFTDDASFFAYCGMVHSSQLLGTFAIISGANTISGTFLGAGTARCFDHIWGQTCSFHGTHVTYAASLVRGGKVCKQFNGAAAVTIGVIKSHSHAKVILEGL